MAVGLKQEYSRYTPHKLCLVYTDMGEAMYKQTTKWNCIVAVINIIGDSTYRKVLVVRKLDFELWGCMVPFDVLGHFYCGVAQFWEMSVWTQQLGQQRAVFYHLFLARWGWSLLHIGLYWTRMTNILTTYLLYILWVDWYLLLHLSQLII